MAVISTDARMLKADVLLRWVKNRRKFSERSKIVCLHVNAIVKPRVTRISMRISFLNSCLN